GLEPGIPYFHNTLAIAFLRSARPEAAVRPLERAIGLGPELHEPLGNLGNTLQALGRYAEAAACYHRALALAPQVGAYWSAFAQSLSSTTGVPSPELRSTLLAALAHEEVDAKMLMRTVVALLRTGPRFEALCASRDDAPPGDAALESSREALEDPLLLRLLESTIVAAPAVERLLTKVRWALLGVVARGRTPPLSLAFFTALARQSFATEYAWFVSAEEDTLLAALEAQVAAIARREAPVREHALAIYAAYRALRRVPGIASLAAPAALQPLWREQVLEPAQEEALKGEIPSLHAVEDPVSRVVQEQYEDNPFPRWSRVARFDHARPLAVV